tara:strand:- start:165 stop:356 length:192 start_codon:yes stop_codon:yes gene_type:complete
MRRRKSSVSTVLKEIGEATTKIRTKVADFDGNKELVQEKLRELSRAVADLEDAVVSRAGYESE